LTPAIRARVQHGQPADGAARQTAIGLTLAALVLGGWLVLHVWGVFLYTPERYGWAAAPLLVLAQAWLGVGLFIVAHDAMHGSLAPGRPRWNAGVGRLATALYNPGFAYPKLHAHHHSHHRAPGTAGDPDFHPDRPREYARWFLRFFRTYFGWWEFARLTVVLCLYLFVLRARPLNFFAFWAAPALLSALQLFTFGTWLPHRHQAESAFADRHHARTLEFGWALSLLTCFHFGYHLEHHRSPGTPWWALPRYRAERRALAQAQGWATEKA
jgi:beta-carotene/zeaxanthin 4-ketolase